MLVTDSASRVSAIRSRIGTTYVEHHDADESAVFDPIQGDGDGRPNRDETAPSTFDRLLSLPDDLLHLGEYLRDIRNLVTEGLDRMLWVSSAELNNTTGTTGTIDAVAWAWAIGFTANMGFAVQLRHIQVGSDTAGPIFLYATKSDKTVASPDKRVGSLRLLGLIRVTATMPTAYSNLSPVLEDGESVLVAIQAASAKLDFACEYRAMRSGS